SPIDRISGTRRSRLARPKPWRRSPATSAQGSTRATATTTTPALYATSRARSPEVSDRCGDRGDPAIVRSPTGEEAAPDARGVRRRHLVGVAHHLEHLGEPGRPDGVDGPPVGGVQLDLRPPLDRPVDVAVADHDVAGERLRRAHGVDHREAAALLV